MTQIVILDFDGVVVDTFDVAVELFHRQYSPMNAHVLRQWFEGNIIARIKEHGISTEEFFAEYGRMLVQLSPVPGMSDALHRLSQHYTIMVVSSSVSTLIEDYLAHHALDTYIDTVLGSDTPGGKDEKIKRIAEETGVPLSNCIFVTDTLGDIREAHIVGVKTIAVSWGFHSQETLSRGAPAAIVDAPQELISIGQLLLS